MARFGHSTPRQPTSAAHSGSSPYMAMDNRHGLTRIFMQVASPPALRKFIESMRTMEDHIKHEEHCPHIAGLSVKPTYFYAFVGYLSTSILALVAHAIFGK